MPGMRQFKVITPWQFLCLVPALTFSHSGEVVLTPYNYAILEELGRSVLSIGVYVLEFVEKCGRKTVEEEDANIDE